MVENDERKLQLVRHGERLRSDYAFNMQTYGVQSLTEPVDISLSVDLAKDLNMPSIEKIIITNDGGVVEVVVYSKEEDKQMCYLTNFQLGILMERYNLGTEELEDKADS